MNTKELLSMKQEDIDYLCGGNCETKKCLFKSSLRKCREDGFCIKQTYHNIERWIQEDKRKIEDLENEIRIIKGRIKKYKQWKKEIEKELENDQEKISENNNLQVSKHSK